MTSTKPKAAGSIRARSRHGRNVEPIEPHGCRRLQVAENGLQGLVEASGQTCRAVDLRLAGRAGRRRHTDVRQVRDQDIGRAPLGKAEEHTPQRLDGTVNQLIPGATRRRDQVVAAAIDDVEPFPRCPCSARRYLCICAGGWSGRRRDRDERRRSRSSYHRPRLAGYSAQGGRQRPRPRPVHWKSDRHSRCRRGYRQKPLVRRRHWLVKASRPVPLLPMPQTSASAIRKARGLAVHGARQSGPFWFTGQQTPKATEGSERSAEAQISFSSSARMSANGDDVRLR